MGMHIQARGFSLSEALENEAITSMDAILTRHHQINNVEVRLEDINGRLRGGTDKRCRVVVTLPGTPSMVITSTSGDMYLAIRQCAARLKNVLNRFRTREIRRNQYNRQDKRFLADTDGVEQKSKSLV